MKFFQITMIVAILTTSLFAATPAPAAPESMWLKILVHYNESDGRQGCQFEFDYSHAYFFGEIVDGHLARAGFGRWDYYVANDLSHLIWMTPAEMQGLELTRDEAGRPWLKKLNLSSRLVAWLVGAVNYSSSFCEVDEIASFAESSINFEFELSGISHGILLSYSQAQTLNAFTIHRAPLRVNNFILMQTVPGDLPNAKVEYAN